MRSLRRRAGDARPDRGARPGGGAAADGVAVPGRRLQADVRVHRPARQGTAAFTLDVHLDVAAGEVLAVVGPNGAGKSTLLAVLAGLLRPSAGTVHLAGRTLTHVDPSGRVHAAVPPEQRGVGLLGQDPRLFPHLSALENVAFGPRARGTRPADARADAVAWLDAVGLPDLAAHRPAELSGGQRQRVALARALAARPHALLLDEPVAALDATHAPLVRQLLREQVARTGTTTVLVTHDVLDAVVLADRVLVLDAGHAVHHGPTGAVLAAPRDPFTAALAGVNLVVGTGERGGVRAPDGRLLRGTDPVPDGVPAAAVFAPAAVSVHTEEPAHASPRNLWPTTVVALEPRGAAVGVRTSGRPEVVADVTAASVAELGLRPGVTVWLSVKATEVGVHLR
ncbi:sulfate/molybdate ABC transporter ATP-binding protein [Cellulomonas cellasea]|uniref:Molybdate transport system ATP-binding protein n=1 Tax=Cellulomonas cellasea TaxID=43670 RepID=A0A7W4YAN5_9CELL|nr:ATP-binding cassette domain-containing protein [Cellulomonas cellasea]MBB2921952.1 molybdate transport system ATP-binding protein [Cellulomonas cellasea]